MARPASPNGRKRRAEARRHLRLPERHRAQRVANALSVRMATDAPPLAARATPRPTKPICAARRSTISPRTKRPTARREPISRWPSPTDPDFALAHAALVARPRLASHRRSAKASELKPLYAAAVAAGGAGNRRSRPTLAEGHLALGYAKFAGFLDVRGAKPSYEKAYELWPRRCRRRPALCACTPSAPAASPRRADAIERALALDPLNPRTHRAAGTDRLCFAPLSQTPSSRYRRALQLNPQISNRQCLHGQRLDADRQAGAKRGRRSRRKSQRRCSGCAAWPCWSIAPATRPRRRKRFDALVAKSATPRIYQQAEVMAQWGQTDEAIARLRGRARSAIPA